MMTLLFIGTTELLLVGGIALLLFGGKKLPEMMRGLGQGVKEFKEGMQTSPNPSEGGETKDTPADTAAETPVNNEQTISSPPSEGLGEVDETER